MSCHETKIFIVTLSKYLGNLSKQMEETRLGKKKVEHIELDLDLLLHLLYRAQILKSAALQVIITYRNPHFVTKKAVYKGTKLSHSFSNPVLNLTKSGSKLLDIAHLFYKFPDSLRNKGNRLAANHCLP